MVIRIKAECSTAKLSPIKEVEEVEEVEEVGLEPTTHQALTN